MVELPLDLRPGLEPELELMQLGEPISKISSNP
jgi:hypothetical protein